MNRTSRYTPAENDTLDALVEKARLCGERLHPNSSLARWIDTHPNADVLIDAYHEGQAARYESEDW